MKAGYQVIHAYPTNYRRVRHYQIQYQTAYLNPYKRLPSRCRKLTMDDACCESPAPESYTVPIIGYEIIEKRQRFTVYKIHVQKQARSWFIFRRYSDFERLKEKLLTLFPSFKLDLPPKRLLGDNFNPDFIARRAQGLQTFIGTILQHRNLRISRAAREFFCLDEPPGPFDSLEESRAYVQFLEEQMENTKSIVTELTSQLNATKSQLREARSQIRSLEWRLRQRPSPDPPGHSTPTAYNCRVLRHDVDEQLSNISGTCPKPRATRKSVNFAQTKSASEGNLLQLKRRTQPHCLGVKDQNSFRHSITFGEDSFVYNGFVDVEFHSNVTRNMKERKRKSMNGKNSGRKQKQQVAHEQSNSTHIVENKATSKSSWTQKRGRHEQEKRDSGIIRDGSTDSE